MQIYKPSVVFPYEIDGVQMLKNIEKNARICYKSEGLITEDSYLNFISKVVLTNHHESVIEHEYVTAIFTIDRGVSHELVRHKAFVSLCSNV